MPTNSLPYLQCAGRCEALDLLPPLDHRNEGADNEGGLAPAAAIGGGFGCRPCIDVCGRRHLAEGMCIEKDLILKVENKPEGQAGQRITPVARRKIAIAGS